MIIERFIAWRYLRSSQNEGFVAVVAWFSFFGILLGVATLIIVMSVMNGFRHELMNRILGFNSHLTLYSHTPVNIEPMAALKEVVSVTPLLEKQGLCMSATGATGSIIRGMQPQDLQKRHLIAQNIVEGRLDQWDKGNAAVIGHKLARRLGLHVGDSMKIMAAEGRSTAFGMMPRTRHFSVMAIFDSGMHEYDSAFVFLPLRAAQDFFDTPHIGTYEIFVKDPERVSSIKPSLQRPGLMIHDWQQANSHFFNAIQVQRNVMFLILTLIVLVAIFNVISCLVMLVKDKTKDIAILRSLGATQGVIMRIFFFMGAFIGILGTACGVALGLGFSYHIETIRQWLEKLSGAKLFQAEIYFLSQLPARVDLYEVSSVIFMSLFFSFAATVYPAWKASRLKPVDGLRYE